MNNKSFNDRRPTPFEEQAHAEARNHFADHLKQFPASLTAIRKLERNLATLALTITMAGAQKSSSESAIRADDSSQWHKGAILFDNVMACHRPTDSGTEFAVIEQFPGGRNEVWPRGRNAVEALRSFVADQKHVLQIWSQDIAAQVKEFLSEKYPGHDTSRVADGFMYRLAHAECLTHQQHQSRGIRI